MKIGPLIAEASLLAERIKAQPRRGKRGGLSESMANILALLNSEGPSSVPRLASSRGISRQGIQIMANALRKEGLIETIPNPAHRSSPLLNLSEKGRAALLDSVSRREQALSRLGDTVSEREVRFAAEVLRAVREAL